MIRKMIKPSLVAFMMIEGATSVYAGTATISNLSNMAYTENDAPIVLDNDITFTNGMSYGSGYMEFSLYRSATTDLLTLKSDATPNNSGAISIVGTDVFLGTGSGTNRIGSIDETKNGQNGQPLRVLFASPLINSGFEESATGWTVSTSEYTSGLAGLTTNVNGGGTASILLGGSSISNSSEISTTEKSTGNASLRLFSSGQLTCSTSPGSTNADGYCSKFGPTATSSPFQAYAGDSINIDWSAKNGRDWYDVLGYLVNTTTGAKTLLFSERGSTRDWTTTTVTIPADGTYEFLFIAGTYDASGGYGVGASLYIDNIVITGNTSVNDATVSSIAQAVQYSSSSEHELNVNRTVTVSTQTESGDISTATSTLVITRTNDTPEILGTTDTDVNENVAYSFTPSASDVDLTDTLTYSIVNQPTWATFDATTGTLSGTPVHSDVGTTSNIVISVTDGIETVSLSPFNLTVLNTSLNAVIEDISGNNDGVPATDVELTNLGITGAVSGRDYSVALANGTYVNATAPTVAEIQIVVDGLNSTIITNNALAIVSNYANDNTQIAPTVQYYIDAGVTGVTVDNLAEINAVIDSLGQDDVDSKEEIQALVDIINAGNVIEGYAEDNSNGTPTLENYTTTGVTGVTADNLAEINAVIDSLGKDDVDTKEEIQSIVNAVNSGNIIEGYAEDNSNGTPTLENYTTTGVTGVTVDNLDVVNTVIDSLGKDDVDTKEELQTVIDQVNGLIAVINTSNGGDTTQEELSNAGVTPTNLTPTELTAINDAIDAADPQPSTPAALQALVDNAKAKEDAVEVVLSRAGGGDITQEELTNTGISQIDLTPIALEAINNVIDASDPKPTTPKELQVLVRVAMDTLSSVLEDIVGNGDGIASSFDQINTIIGDSLAIEGVDYTSALQGGTYVDPENPTVEEIQAIINSVNGMNEVIDDIEGNNNSTDVTAEQINAIEGISGANEGINYSELLASGTFVDRSNPTIDELLSLIAMGEVAEDVAGNANGIGVTADQLNAITGIDNAVEGYDYATVLANAEYVDPENPTVEEIQSVINDLNALNGLAEVLEDIAGNSNDNPTTAEQINAIVGINNAVEGYDYTDALANGEYVNPENPTVAEIQSVINKLNAINGLAEVIEDIAGNDNGKAVTAEQINAIDGVSGAIDGYNYLEALANGEFEDSEYPSVEELQAIINHVNTINGLALVAEDVAGNVDKKWITAEQLNAITGVHGAITGRDYSKALLAGRYDNVESPTASEIQTIINRVNASYIVLPRGDTDITTDAQSEEFVGQRDYNLSREVGGVETIFELDYDKENLEIGSLQFVGTSEAGEPLIVEGEGVWSIDENGNIVFTPEEGFEFDPTPIVYNVSLVSGEEQVRGEIRIDYGVEVKNIKVEIEANGETVEIDLEENLRGDTREIKSIVILLPEGLDAILSEDGQELSVEGEGVWHIEDNVLTFTPEDDFVGVPTPIQYQVLSENGKESEVATISLYETAVKGVSIQNDEESSEGGKSSKGIPVFGGIGIFVMMMLGTLFGGFFMRRKEKK